MEFLSDGGTVVPDEDSAAGADKAMGNMLKGDGCKMSTVSDQTAVPSEAEESDQEPESLADVDTKSHASSAGTMKGLPIIIKASTMKAPVGKMARCFLCRRKADELSPLVKASATDQWGGFVPWCHYNKVRNPAGVVIGKKPSGETCMICKNVYKAIGYRTRYGTTGQYKKVTMTGKYAKTIHAAFLAAEKEWIKEHNDNPELKKLKDKKHLMEAHRKLEVVKEDAGEFIKPEMEFVLVDDWDVQTDGKFDASKVVEKEVFGKLEKGIWQTIGKKGALHVS